MSQESTSTIAPSQSVPTIELESTTGGITAVSVYSNRAVITRTFKFKIMTGQSQLNISGLPKVLDTNSVRVEGPSSVTIYGVTISIILPTRTPTSSDTLEKLFEEKKHTEKSCERAKKSLPSLETYLGFLKIEHLDTSNLLEAVKSYDKAAEELDGRIAKLENLLVETNKAILAEKTKLSESSPAVNATLNLKASIGLRADSEGEVDIALIYAVQNATWDAEYDISVDTSDEKGNLPVTLTYKGGITQNTGENWDNVPLTLETGTPTLRLEVPALTKWDIAIYRQPQIAKKSTATPSTSSPWPPIRWKHGIPSNESSNQPVTPRRLDFSTRGDVGANFKVLGLITIPSGGNSHIVTIAKKLTSNATKSWVCVPKKDTKTYLNAKIKNTSSHNFLSGQANVYVNGNFVSKSDVPLVGPGESFDCLLGVDPSIRVTYPRSKPVSKSSFSGFYTKTTTYISSQRITVTNSKTLAIKNLKIIDQVPVTEDPYVSVKLVSPALKHGEDFSESGGNSRVPVAPGVNAQWHGADERDVEGEASGKDGKLSWVCTVPAQRTIGWDLRWEVTAPSKTFIVGLTR